MLRAAAEQDFAVVASWFFPTKTAHYDNDNELVRHWAGPSIIYPCTELSLAEQISGGHYQSYVLVDRDSIIGFGQMQLVRQRAHLARLVIKKAYRGKRLAKRLLSELIDVAQAQIKLKEVSLFVYHDNTIAVACYEKFGFAESPTPKAIQPMERCRFMSLRY